MDAIRVNSTELGVGQALPWAVYDDKGTLLLKKGYVISSAHQLGVLLAHGLYRRPGDGGPAPADAPPPKVRECPFDLINDLPERLSQGLNGLSRGQPEAVERIQRVAREVQNICALDADAALGAVHLCRDQSYPLMHLVHGAILCEVVMCRMQMDAPGRLSTLAAALTCNLAMLDYQAQLNAQTTPLTDAQRARIRRHPLEGADLLRSAGVTDELWLDVVLQHHERPDGSGYAAGLEGNAIRVESRIVCLADIYSAMITPRGYRDGILAKEALREIFLGRGKEVDEQLSLMFIKELGVFPPGAFVALDNGEKGIVIKRGRDGTCPTVSSILSPRGGPYARPLKRLCDKDGFRVREMLPRDPTLPLNLRLLWDY